MFFCAIDLREINPDPRELCAVTCWEQKLFGGASALTVFHCWILACATWERDIELYGIYQVDQGFLKCTSQPGNGLWNQINGL